MNNRGQASVIGGLFAIAIIILLFVSLSYVQMKYLELLREVYYKNRVKDIVTENIELKVNYTEHVKPLASTVTTYSIVCGYLTSGNIESLDYPYDNDYMEIESSIYAVEVIEVVKNGEFDEDFNYWTTEAKTGEWSIITIDTDNVAQFYAYTKPPTAVAWGTLKQDVYVTTSFQKAVLSFDFLMYVNRRPVLFELNVYIEEKLVYSYTWTTNTDWIHVEVDVTDYVRLGENNLTFFIFCVGIRREFKVLLDSISLKIYKVIGVYPGNVVDVVFNIELPNIVAYANIAFLLKTNCTATINVYVFDYFDNVWRLFAGVYTEGDKWFWISLNITEARYLKGYLKIRIYAISGAPMKLYIDYLSIDLYPFAYNNAFVEVKNVGSVIAYVISVWLINATHHIRYSVEEYIDVNMTSRVQIANSTFFLSPNCEYKVRVWTKVRSYEITFRTPGN